MTYYTPVGTKDQLGYAKTFGNQSLTFYQDYFNVTYPLPKAGEKVIFYTVSVKEQGLSVNE